MPAVDARDYKALYGRTKEMPLEIRKAFRKRLREAGNIGRDATRAKILAMPSKGGKHHLRATLAANIRVSVTGNNVQIRQHTAGLTGRNAAGLPRLLDQSGTFDHPVFERGQINEFLRNHPGAGHRHGAAGAASRAIRRARTPQASERGWPYFREELSVAQRSRLEAAVAEVLDDITDHLRD